MLSAWKENLGRANFITPSLSVYPPLLWSTAAPARKLQWGGGWGGGEGMFAPLSPPCKLQPKWNMKQYLANMLYSSYYICGVALRRCVGVVCNAVSSTGRHSPRSTKSFTPNFMVLKRVGWNSLANYPSLSHYWFPNTNIVPQSKTHMRFCKNVTGKSHFSRFCFSIFRFLLPCLLQKLLHWEKWLSKVY